MTDKSNLSVVGVSPEDNAAIDNLSKKISIALEGRHKRNVIITSLCITIFHSVLQPPKEDRESYLNDLAAALIETMSQMTEQVCPARSANDELH